MSSDFVQYHCRSGLQRCHGIVWVRHCRNNDRNNDHHGNIPSNRPNGNPTMLTVDLPESDRPPDAAGRSIHERPYRFKNVTSEGPGTIEDHLRIGNIPCTIIDLEQGQPLPAIDAYTHLIIMGGPMAVYEMDRTPYLKDEALFIDKAVKAGKHVLGVCLGAQMLAHVLGSRVSIPGLQRRSGGTGCRP